MKGHEKNMKSKHETKLFSLNQSINFKNKLVECRFLVLVNTPDSKKEKNNTISMINQYE